jgi:hypothetical protein
MVLKIRLWFDWSWCLCGPFDSVNSLGYPLDGFKPLQRPILNFSPRGKLWPPRVNLSPRGEVIPWGWNSVCPSILLNNRVLTPGGEQRGELNPKGTNFTPGCQVLPWGARSEVKNGPQVPVPIHPTYWSINHTYVRKNFHQIFATKSHWFTFMSRLGASACCLLIKS